MLNCSFIKGNRWLVLCCLLPTAGIAADFAYPRFEAYRSFQREFSETKTFADLGVPLRAFGVCNTASGKGTPYSDYPMVWLGPGKYDWASCDRQFDDLIAASPSAKFIVLVDLNSPMWLARKLNIDSFSLISHAACMPYYQQQTTRYLRDFLTHIESKYSDRTFAYVLLGGRTTEWFEAGAGMTSPAKNAAWRRWCQTRGVDYGETVPSEIQLARAAFEGVVYDPASEPEKIAYARFHNGVIADTVLNFAKEARTIVGRNKLIGSFFGYYFICNKGLASVGHLDYERVMASPDFDFVISPATYSDRACGFGTGTMTVPLTLRRYGKRLLHEIDFWPHDLKLPWRTKARDYFGSDADDVAGNLRDAVFAFVRGASWWWFDQYGKFYASPGMHEKIRRLSAIARECTHDPKPVADVLVVADSDSAYLMADPAKECPGGFRPALGCGEELRNRLGVSPFAYDLCSFDDLSVLDLSKVKLVLLPASWQLTPTKAQLLRDKVLRDGRTIVWTYAPGLSDGKSLDVRRVAEWAGVPFKTKTVATTRMSGGWTSVYAYDYRQLTPEKLREIAAAAGVFAYCDEPLPVAVNAECLAVHAKQGGTKTFRLPYQAEKIVDLFTGETLGEKTDSFTANLASPDTRLFSCPRATVDSSGRGTTDNGAAASDDAVKHNSTEMNRGTPAAAVQGSDSGTRLLIIGNSIAIHGPNSKLGWTNFWGMAASARERDFAHLIAAEVSLRTGREANLRIKSGYRLERDFRGTDIAREFAEEIAFKPEILVVALGENALIKEGTDDGHAWQAALVNLVKAIRAGGANPVVVLRSPFWQNPLKCRATEAAAKELDAHFVDAGPLGQDPANMAIGLFWHKGVAAHPGDLGMRRIADLILEAIYPVRHSKEVQGALGPFVERGEIAGVISVLSDKDYVETWDLFGFADVEGKRQMAPDTMFAVFSMSKTFLGAAMMCAIDDGVISLDDPVSKFLPEYADIRFEDGRKPKRELTIRDVTCHVDGLRKEIPLGNKAPPLREAARRYAAQPLVAEPGETFKYGTTRFCTAGACLEVATGKRYEDFLEDRILRPLGLRDTTFNPTPDQIARMVKPYTTRGGKFGPACDTCSKWLNFPKPGRLEPSPGGGLFSTAADMIRFSQMLAHHGEYKGKTIISRKTFDGIFSVLQVGPKISQPYTCGSWRYGDWFGHEGAMRTDQRANLRTGESRVFFIQTENAAGKAFFDAKITWHRACDVYQREAIPFSDELVKTHENDVDRTKAYQR